MRWLVVVESSSFFLLLVRVAQGQPHQGAGGLVTGDGLPLLASLINCNAACDPMSRITQLVYPALHLAAINHNHATTACIALFLSPLNGQLTI